MKRKKPKIDRICENCKLFNPATSECSIVVLHEGQRHRLPVSAKDSCFFEGEYFNPLTNETESLVDDIKEVKFWVEDKDGKKIDGNGIVKIEYPEGFFGTD